MWEKVKKICNQCRSEIRDRIATFEIFRSRKLGFVRRATELAVFKITDEIDIEFYCCATRNIEGYTPNRIHRNLHTAGVLYTDMHTSVSAWCAHFYKRWNRRCAMQHVHTAVPSLDFMKHSKLSTYRFSFLKTGPGWNRSSINRGFHDWLNVPRRKQKVCKWNDRAMFADSSADS